MTDQWRYECPEGHVSITNNVGRKPGSDGRHRWYCNTCGTGYNRLLDKKTGDYVEG